jgi:hypothetical protein
MAKDTSKAEQTTTSTGWTPEKRLAHAAKMREVFAKPEERAKISAGVKAYYADHTHPLKGKTMSDAAKARIREGVQRYYATHDHPNKGIALTESHKDSIRQAMLARNKANETDEVTE